MRLAELGGSYHMDGGPYHMDWFLYDRDLRHEKVNHELDIYHRGVYIT